MLYRVNKKQELVSALGYGCMRFSKKGASIDFEKTEKEILRAVELGVNYFDTAYIYPGSEECLGKILEKNNLREKVSIATKLPQYMMKNAEQIEKTFQEELKRLRTTYIDYYLMHMFTDYAEWEHLKEIGILDFIERHKKDGTIKNIGFSYHGETSMFIKIVEAYDWDFCQIQYNYLDEHSQAGRTGLLRAKELGIPVVIMEPLRGGKLVRLPEKAKEKVEKAGYTPAELGLKWLWNHDAIMCVLSGMNSIEMLEENCKIASSATVNTFTDNEFKLVEDVKKIIKEKEKVGCTGCRYCMPCPKGVNIPGNFYYYNLMYAEKKSSARLEFAQNMGIRLDPGFASQCIGCGKCEKHCPQGLPIREKLKEADKHLRPLWLKIGLNVARKIMIKKKK